MNDEIPGLKQRAAEAAVDFVESGMVVGLGHGSTAAFAVQRIAELLSVDDSGDVVTLMQTLCVERFDLLMDLPAIYAPEIEEQCNAASDEELLEAGKAVLGVVFPLVRRVIEAMTGAAAGLGMPHQA